MSQTPRKLTYLSTAVVPSTQASSIQVMKMCSAMSRSGFDVTLLCGKRPRNKSADVFKYYGVENAFSIVSKRAGFGRGSTFLLSMRFYPTFLRLAKSKQDILFYGRDVLALNALARAGRRIIYEAHDFMKKGPRSWAERKLIQSPMLDRIVFISHELKKAFLEKYGSLISGKKMMVAPDAADEQPNFHDSIDLKGEIDFSVCYIGSFLNGRGIELLVDVAAKMPNVGFHLFGGTDSQVCRLEKNSPPNLWFYEHIPPAQTYKVRNAADVLVMPYQRTVMVAQNASETSRWMSPIKLFEYMSARKPIISSNHPSLREVLEDKRNCLLCEPDDVGQWIDAIAEIVRDKQLRNRIAQAAYRDFHDKYTWDKRVQSILAESQDVLNG